MSCRATAHPMIPPPTMITSKFNRLPPSAGRIDESLLVKQVFQDLTGAVQYLRGTQDRRPARSCRATIARLAAGLEIGRNRSDFRNLSTASYMAGPEAC